jgi:nitrite reductase (NO-forming)
VKPRDTMLAYQTASRLWLTAAALSLLLAPADRLGLWLPLHLTLAGAISVAISGAMQTFALALTATPAPGSWVVWSQFACVNVGVASIAIGLPGGRPGLVGIGGAIFTAGIAILGWLLHRAWRRGLNRRHAVPIAAYAVAIGALLAGATLGVAMGSDLLGGASYLDARRAHMVLNVLGWGMITVAGTLVTLLPTVLRVRMPPWRGGTAIAMLGVGVAAIAGGLAFGRPALAGGGGLVYLAGVAGVLGLVRAILGIRRAYGVPVAGLHVVAALAWWTVGSVGLAWALLRGVVAFDAYRPVFLTAFVGGSLVQVLLGAWSYLLPMNRPGHPADRRRALSAFEVLAWAQVVSLNAGLVLVALRGAGWLGARAADVGVVLALAGGALALAKAWLFPLLARGPVETERARSVWGSGEG